jgi:hypothetical protein
MWYHDDWGRAMVRSQIERHGTCGSGKGCPEVAVALAEGARGDFTEVT